MRLVSMYAAVDFGTVVHRDGLLNQIEGDIVQAASWTLKEKVLGGAAIPEAVAGLLGPRARGGIYPAASIAILAYFYSRIVRPLRLS